VARLSLRLLGLALLTFAISVSSCQALFPRDAPRDTAPIEGEHR
jgi:hypothetical protein